MVQLSHPYMTTGKTIALPSWTFIDDIHTTVYKIDNQQGPTCIAQRTILNVL